MSDHTFKRITATLERLSGNAAPTKTLEIVFKALAEEGIPALYCGGLALAEYGYTRFTEDADIIVPSEYKGKLGDILWRTLTPAVPNGTVKFVCKPNGGDVDVLYGGERFGTTSTISNPLPTQVTSVPTPVPVEDLVAMKLDAYLRNPVKRARDLGDVVELIQASRLPRYLKLPTPELQVEYGRVWDALEEESR